MGFSSSTQLVKNLPSILEIPVQFLVLEEEDRLGRDTMEKE